MASDSKNQYRYLSLTNVYRQYKPAQSKLNVIVENPEELSHGSYGGLLFDPRWKAKRLSILDRDAHKCILCSSNNNLQVHHRQYHFIRANKEFSLPWEYEDHLLITLCERCHQKGHRQYKVPTKYI